MQQIKKTELHQFTICAPVGSRIKITGGKFVLKSEITQTFYAADRVIVEGQNDMYVPDKEECEVVG